MIRINLARKGAKGGGGLDLKNFKLSSLLDLMRGGGGEGEEKKKLDFNNPVVKAIAAFVVVYLVGDTIETYKAEELAKVEAEIAAIEAEKSAIGKKLAKIKGFEPIKKQLEEDEKQIRLKLDVVKKLLEDRNAPSKMMMQIAQSIPDEVWLTDLSIDADAVKLAGSTPSYNQVSDFIRALSSTSQFTDINLSGIAESTAGTEKGAAVQNFDLTAKRRKN